MYEYAPKVLNNDEIRGGWGPHHGFLSFNANSWWGSGIPCSMRWCIVMYEDYVWRDPETANHSQLSPYDSGPKRDSAISLLTSQPCWDMVAIHQSSTTPSIQGCTAVISEQDCLKISFHMSLHPLQPFLFDHCLEMAKEKVQSINLYLYKGPSGGLVWPGGYICIFLKICKMWDSYIIR